MITQRLGRIVFRRPVEVTVLDERRVSALGVTSQGFQTVEDAMSVLAEDIASFTMRYIRAYTSDLSSEERDHKRLLLGTIDIVQSELDVPSVDAWTFLGEIVDITGTLHFQISTTDGNGPCYPVPALVADSVLPVTLKVGDLCTGDLARGSLVALRVVSSHEDLMQFGFVERS